MSVPLIELEDVRKSYRTSTIETRALAGVSLSILPREFVAVTGPSGCGKSTLLNVLGLLDYADSGIVRLAGRTVSRRGRSAVDPMRRGMIGFIFQSFNLIEDMTLRENVAMPLVYLGVPKAERRVRALAKLDKVGLGHRADHRPSQLSGGQQQRAAIARALAIEPKIILADEPTGNLDSSNSAAVTDILEGLADAGTTVVMVTHAADLAARANRRIVMHDGRIVDCATG